MFFYSFNSKFIFQIFIRTNSVLQCVLECVMTCGSYFLVALSIAIGYYAQGGVNLTSSEFRKSVTVRIKK